MTQSIKIRSMEPSDIAALAEIERLCFSDPWSYESISEELHNPSAAFFVALSDQKPVGYAGMYYVADEGYINNVAVHPVYRRLGIAKLLFQRLEQFAKGKRLSFLTLEARVSNTPAISLYTLFGFQKAGLRRGYYRNPAEDAVLMTKYYENNETEVPN